MLNEFVKLDYRAYYHSIRNHAVEKNVLLTKENCEVIGQPVGFLEQPDCLLDDNGYEKPLYKRENIEIVFKDEFFNCFPTLGIEEKTILKNKLSLPNESPICYLMISGRLHKVFTIEQIRKTNSVIIYDEKKVSDNMWKEYQINKRFPNMNLEPSGYYFERIQQSLQPLFDVEKLLQKKQLKLYTEKELYQIRSFVIGIQHKFDSFPQSWKIKLEPKHMKELGYYRGESVIQLLPSAFTDSPFANKLNNREIEDEDILCTLWDVETVRDVLNANNRKITSLIPKGMTVSGLAVFSSKEIGWLKERLHVFFACNKF